MKSDKTSSPIHRTWETATACSDCMLGNNDIRLCGRGAEAWQVDAMCTEKLDDFKANVKDVSEARIMRDTSSS